MVGRGVRGAPAIAGWHPPRLLRAAARTAAATAVALAPLAPATRALAGPSAAAAAGPPVTAYARTAASTLPPAPVTPPPDLVALEAKTAAIHFNTERFRLTAEVRVSATALGGGGRALTSPFVDAVAEPSVLQEGSWIAFGRAGQGVSSVSPPAVQFSVPGGREEVRTVGGVLYTHKPSVASFDGHRPWVAKKQTQPSGALGPTSEGLAAAIAPGSSTGSFAGLIELLGRAQRIEELGPVVAGSQPATAFSARMDIADLITGKSALKALEKLAKGGITVAQLEVAIASNGLPATVGVSLEAPGVVSESIVSDVLALEVPVNVQAPPAREVISEARLKRLERRRVTCIRVLVPRRHGKPRRRRVCSHRAPSGPEGEEATPLG
jgi:hypothetical protein